METPEEFGGTSGREIRRRRIVERGSDRMALITGRIQALPPSSSSPKHSHTQSSPAFFSQDQPLPQPPLYSSDFTHIGRKGENDAFNFGSRVEPQLRKCETSITTLHSPDAAVRNDVQQFLVTPDVPKASVDKKVPSKGRGSRPDLFTAKEINSCIMASESTRVLCSLIIAALVVLSHINLPHSIVKAGSTITSRPLYILLLTDVTIVLVRLLEKQRGFVKNGEEEKRGVQEEDGQNWGGAVKILELGLVFYQTIRAIFIDISFYMVFVICGLSLV